MKLLFTLCILLMIPQAFSASDWFVKRCVDERGIDYRDVKNCSECATIRYYRNVMRIAYGKRCSEVFQKSFAKKAAKELGVKFVDLTK